MRTFLFIILLGCMAFGQTQSDMVKTFTLQNGMKLLINEDHSIPNATLYFFYKVGSRNEYPGITGLSHFFEHMMFNGAKKYGFKMFDRVMEAAGGSNNASTSENLTVYTDWYPSSAIETMFDLEADRIQFLSFEDSVIESERGVILSEYTTGLENSNFEFLYQEILGVAMIAHPYHWSVIGYESDIRNWKKEDLVQYFKTYYAPNNCTVVVSGDVSTDAVLALAKKYFEPIPSQVQPRPITTVEPEQKGEKRIVVQKDVYTPWVMAAYHVPGATHPDYFALDILSSILSDGNSSRLYKTLVDSLQYVTDIGTYMPMGFDPFLFWVYAELNEGVKTEDVEKAIYAEINAVVTSGVTQNELQKVKNQKLMGFYRQIETISGRSDLFGTYEVFFGDYKKVFTLPDEYQKVTVDDIKRVAATYFKQKNRTVGILIPEAEEAAQ